jgi:hypothetical protein
MRSYTLPIAFLTIALTGCFGDEPKEAPPTAPDYGAEDGKDDSARHPSSIEPIVFGDIATTSFTWWEQFRAFTFSGQAGQTVELYVDGLDGIDTVLYLYKVSATSGRPFGHPLAANDDTAEPNWTVFSNPEPNPYSSNVLAFELPEDRDYALVATTFWQLYEGEAEVVVKSFDVPVEPECIPVCDAIGSRSEGWYDCNGLIRWEFCEGCTAVCDAIGSRSEGWYSSCDNQLIVYAECG